MRRRATKARALEIVGRLEPQYHGLTTGLVYSSPLQLLVATILSAQCTDERVNSVTPILFTRYQSAADYAAADAAELEQVIHPLGFFRNKTKNIQAMAQALTERFGGEVPGSMEELLTLPGVARKTANVVLSHAFGTNEGIAVDTHVQRLSLRLGLSAQTHPIKIEADLMRLYPRALWGRVSDLLIWHGRRVCYARSPACDQCVLMDVCPSAGTG